MNPIYSHAIALVSGLLIGVFGNYFANRLTDKAKVRDSKAEEIKSFRDAKKKMPELLNEMKVDLKLPSMKSCREFIISPSKRAVFNLNQPTFRYHEDEHAGLRSKIRILENLGFVFDITETKTPRYQFNENFVELLLNN